MSYSSFKKELEQALVTRGDIPNNIFFKNTIKNNNVLTKSVCIKETDMPIAPSIGIDYFYDQYQKGRCIDDIAESICEIYFSQPDLRHNDYSITWDRIKDYVVYHLVNLNSNPNLTETCPYIPVGDLMLIFKINTSYLGIDGYITINTKLMNSMKLNLKTLAQAAHQNTERLLPLMVLSANDFLPELYNDSDSYICNPVPLYIVTNEQKLHGAISIFYNEFEKAHPLNEEDYYILPSSIHEVLILDTNEHFTREELSDMVKQVNETAYVSEIEYLSDSVYCYSELKEKFREALMPLGIEF